MQPHPFTLRSLLHSTAGAATGAPRSPLRSALRWASARLRSRYEAGAGTAWLGLGLGLGLALGLGIGLGRVRVRVIRVRVRVRVRVVGLGLGLGLGLVRVRVRVGVRVCVRVQLGCQAAAASTGGDLPDGCGDGDGHQSVDEPVVRLGSGQAASRRLRCALSLLGRGSLLGRAGRCFGGLLIFATEVSRVR